MLRNLNLSPSLKPLGVILCLGLWVLGVTTGQGWGAAAASAAGVPEGGLDEYGRLMRVSAIKILSYDPWDEIVAGRAAPIAESTTPVRPDFESISKDEHIHYGVYKDGFGFDEVKKSDDLTEVRNARYLARGEISDEEFEWGEWVHSGVDEYGLSTWTKDKDAIRVSESSTSTPAAATASSSPRDSGIGPTSTAASAIPRYNGFEWRSSEPATGAEAAAAAGASTDRPVYVGYKPGTHGDYLQRLVYYKGGTGFPRPWPYAEDKSGGDETKGFDPAKKDIATNKISNKANLLLVRMVLDFYEEEAGVEYLFGVYVSGHDNSLKLNNFREPAKWDLFPEKGKTETKMEEPKNLFDEMLLYKSIRSKLSEKACACLKEILKKEFYLSKCKVYYARQLFCATVTCKDKLAPKTNRWSTGKDPLQAGLEYIQKVLFQHLYPSPESDDRRYKNERYRVYEGHIQA